MKNESIPHYPDLMILGSTGSVGEQAVDVARAHGVPLRAVTAHRSVAAVEAQIREFHPDYAVLTDQAAAADLRARVADTSTKVLSGFEGITHMLHTVRTENPRGITVENSILGEAGLLPTLEALKAGHTLALANKESLVVGGELVMALAREQGTTILPVDSEHCAIFQCLRAGRAEEINRILLTASGGPFYGYTREQLKDVTKAMTLKHPTWTMGAKITVDSATLMNKGFEVIEAAHLFGVSPDKIDVVIHRESILHSAVEYVDNSIIGEFSLPDMRMCVQYAVDYPDRCRGPVDSLDLFALGKMTFARPDTDTFPLLAMAKSAFFAGGSCPAVLNAADEVAVEAFLEGRISFARIPEVVMRTYDALISSARHGKSLEQIISYDREARKLAKEYI